MGRKQAFAVFFSTHFSGTTDRDGSRPGLLKAEQRVPDFHFLIKVVHENRDFLFGEVHIPMVTVLPVRDAGPLSGFDRATHCGRQGGVRRRQ